VPLRDGKDALAVNWLEVEITDATGKITYPIFNTPQNKPHLIRPLRRPGSPSGTTSTSCGGYTVSFLTPPGAASMAKAS
jgi:hypothetical protein